MKEFVINDDNLKDEDIEMKVVRVKGLIFNSKNQILTAYHLCNIISIPTRTNPMSDCYHQTNEA